jgi:hypothetical protein
MSMSIPGRICGGLGIAAAALTLGAVAQMGQAPSSGVLPDVVGIRPGIPIAEAYQLLKAHEPKGFIQYEQNRLQEFPGKVITHALLYSPTGSEQDREIIVVDITFPPAQQTVWRVSRYLRFEADKEPLPATLLTALRQKYGQEVHTTIPQNTFWVFDRQGHPAGHSSGVDLSDCAASVDRPTSLGLPVQNASADSSPISPLRVWLNRSVVAANRDACHAFVYVTATQLLDYSNNSLVQTLLTTVTDVGVLERSEIAAKALLDNAATAQQQSVMKKAKEQPAPVF